LTQKNTQARKPQRNTQPAAGQNPERPAAGQNPEREQSPWRTPVMVKMRRAACSHGPKETSLVGKTGTASERRAGAETLLEQDPSHRLKYPAQKTDTSQHLCGIRRGTGNLGGANKAVNFKQEPAVKNKTERALLETERTNWLET
jgi:hypothetical protein